MDKRTFIKTTATLMSAPIVAPLASWIPDTKLTNWAGNLQYSTNRLHTPNSIAAVQEAVKKHAHIKALGSRHCFNTIADNSHNLLSQQELDKVLHLDREARTVQVHGAIRYGQLAEYLHREGFAVHNLASLPHISVAGAITTATHGSGMRNGNLATSVAAIEFIAADGTIHTLSRQKDGEQFLGAVVGLGALGVINKVTLDVVPTFEVRQTVYTDLPFEQFQRNATAILGAGYSVSLFTDWSAPAFNEVWIKSLVDEKPFSIAPEFYGSKAATRNLHPIAIMPAENCTDQMGVPGPWHERLPHFKMGFTPSSGKELQSEYFVPVEKGVMAVMAVAQLSKAINPHILTSEIRTIAADNLWLSPQYGQDTLAIHFTWKQDWPAVKKVLPQIEAALKPFAVRPHWGKLFTMEPAQLQALYPKMQDFKKLVKQYDPKGKFRNEFLAVNLGI
jgi:alditol oxidase